MRAKRPNIRYMIKISIKTEFIISIYLHLILNRENKINTEKFKIMP